MTCTQPPIRSIHGRNRSQCFASNVDSEYCHAPQIPRSELSWSKRAMNLKNPSKPNAYLHPFSDGSFSSSAVATAMTDGSLFLLRASSRASMYESLSDKRVHFDPRFLIASMICNANSGRSSCEANDSQIFLSVLVADVYFNIVPSSDNAVAAVITTLPFNAIAQSASQLPVNFTSCRINTWKGFVS